MIEKEIEEKLALIREFRDTAIILHKAAASPAIKVATSNHKAVSRRLFTAIFGREPSEEEFAQLTRR